MSALPIGVDDLYPRDDEHRYRLYGRTGRRKLTVLAAASSMSAIGIAIATIHEDMRSVGGQLSDLGATGVLDAVRGEWIVLPWQRDENHLRKGDRE